MTLTDREYQRLRDAARAVMTEIGVETGGSNVQFAVNPEGRARPRHRDEPARVALERARVEGDRLSRSRRSPRSSPSATRSTSSRTTSRGTSAAFEPTIDYVVVKWPRFAFEKFPGADAALGTQMKSVGEVMSIGRTFCEALQKAARSLETGQGRARARLLDRVDYRVARASRSARRDLVDGGARARGAASDAAAADAGARLRDALEQARRRSPTADRLFYVADAMRVGVSATKSSTQLTAIDPWFLAQIRRIVDAERRIARGRARRRALRDVKRLGFCDRADRDARAARPRTTSARRARPRGIARRLRARRHVRRRVRRRTRRTSTRRTRSESEATPTRPAQGHHPRRRPEPHRAGHRVRLLLRARRAWRCASSGSRPSWSTATPRRCRPTTTRRDRLYFEPLTLEDVLAICDEEKPDGRHRAVRRADAAQARRAAREARREAPRHERRRHRSRRGSRALRRAARRKLALQAAARAASRRRVDEARRDRRRDRLSRCSCARATCSAAAR